jgi:hypothetical protein
MQNKPKTEMNNMYSTRLIGIRNELKAIKDEINKFGIKDKTKSLSLINQSSMLLRKIMMLLTED